MNPSTEVVLNHHLQASLEGVDAIMEDFTDDSVVITPEATFRGSHEIRHFFTTLLNSLPDGFFEEAFQMKRQDIDGDVAYIVWEAKPWFPLATDTFVVRDGKIRYQTFAAYAAA